MRQRWAQLQARVDRTDAEHALRRLGRHEDDVPGAGAQPDEHRLFRAYSVEHRPGIVDQEPVGESFVRGGRATQAVPSRIAHYDAAEPGEEGHLRLPPAALDDGVGHQQVDRRPTVAVYLVVDRDPVPVDEAGLRRLERAHQISSASSAAARAAPSVSTGR